MFLQNLRKSVKPVVWIIAIGFVVSLFFTYGRFTSRGGGEKPLLEVNGEKISYLDFLQAYRSAYESVVRNTGESLSPEMEAYLRSQILSDLLSNRLLYHEAKRAKIKVSDEEVADQMAKIMKNFGSRENFLRYLQYQGIKYADFEEEVRRQIAISRLTQMIKDSVVLTDEEVKSYWIAENESLDLAYLFLDPEKYASDIKVDAGEAKKFYEDNKEDFRVPEKVKVAYVLISPEEFEKEVKITEEEIKNYYEQHPDEFKVEEKRRASHILISVPLDATEEQKEKARKKLQEIKEKLQKEDDFSKLAREYSDDKASAQKGGDLGFFAYSDMTPEFSKAVFSMKKTGEISDIVETPYGFHLIKLTGIEPARKKSLKEVKNDIQQILLEQKTGDLALEEIKKVRDQIEKGKLTFEKYAREHPERVKFPSPFSRYEKIEGLSWNSQLNKIAFSLDPGKLSSILKVAEGYLIMMLEEKKPSSIPPWDEVKEEAMDKLAREKAKKITAQRAQDILKEIKENKKKLSDFAQEWEYQVLNSITRSQWLKGITGEDREKFIRVAFSLTEGEVSNPVFLSQGYYIIQVFKRQIPLEKFEQEKQEFRKKLLARKQEEALSTWFREVREKAKIVDNTSLFFAPSS